MLSKSYDVVIIGGGLIGTAVTRELLKRFPYLTLAIAEKENSFACHQSGHNSGVIHAGIYYKPKSLKAKLCVEGLNLTYEYCNQKGIPYKRCGKLIVAVNEKELTSLQFLYENGFQNGIKDLVLVNPEEMKHIEPNCAGLKALWSPNTGIVDWAKVNHSYGKDCQESGCDVYFQFEVTKLIYENDSEESKRQHPLLVCCGDDKVLRCKYVVACAGLHSDKVAVLSGCLPEPKIIPFRGDYLVLKPEKSDLVKTNIYPVHNPELPFLGVHFTPRMNGSVWLGPNAVLALKREGYKPSDVKFSDLYEILSYPGFQRLAHKHFWYGLGQVYRRINVAAEVAELKKYVPSLERRDVVRGPSGVRAQVASVDGNLVDDFLFDSGRGPIGERVLNVRNAPSPAATSSLSIARVIVERLQQKFSLIPNS